MNKITINGKTYRAKGNISIINDRILVDGQPIDAAELEDKTINVTIEGKSVKVDNIQDVNSVTITGDVETVNSVNGDVRVTGTVKGNVVNMNGDIRAETIEGSATNVNGDIHGARKGGA